jgi:ComF family protein
MDLLSRVRGGLASLAGDVWETLLPKQCVVCDVPHQHPGPMCRACAEQVDELQKQVACPRCALPLPDAEQPCGWCRGAGMRPFRRVVRLAIYEPPVRDLILALKFHGRWWLAGELARRLKRKPAVRDVLGDADVLIPIPLHPLRQVGRGYNQSDELARRLARSKVNGSCLVRVKHTPPQSLQDSRASRVAHLRDAFALVKPAAVTGRRVVLIDDVRTTGATLRSAARAVRAGRPASLDAIVVAIADPQGRAFTSLDRP